MNPAAAKANDNSAGLHSQLVRVSEMPWNKTRFEGIEAKTLFIDRSTGMLTALVKMAPGATLPDHEHVSIEQTFVIEGSLVDKHGPDAGLVCGAGDFVWRPAGSRHVAWSPTGGLMIGIFQMPNKFHEKDGRITDMSGKDWFESWGHVA